LFIEFWFSSWRYALVIFIYMESEINKSLAWTIIAVLSLASCFLFRIMSASDSYFDYSLNSSFGASLKDESLATSSQSEIPGSDNGESENHLPESGDRELEFLFFGDLMIDRHVGEKIAVKGLDYLFSSLIGSSTEAVFDFSAYDLVSLNLEGAVTNNGAHYAPQNAYDFAFAPEKVARLKEIGFNFFNLANNHFSDQGERGIIETRKNLDALGIPYVGCKDREVADCSVKIMEYGDQKVGLAGFSSVYGLIDIEAAAEKVSDLAKTTDYVVAQMHWGTEYQHVNGRLQAEMAHKLIDAGADVIIGHHPHVIQGIEVYQGKPIFYSLGNFVFDQYFSEDTQRGLAIGLALDKDGIEASIFPLRSVASQVSLADEKEKEKILKNVADWSTADAMLREQIILGQISLKNKK
jgi:poly-gamma-glutamate synthesis protein (capsule biosynthesis protein)